MAGWVLNERMVEAAVYGGAILGGGGGGWIQEGLKVGRLALEIGTPRLITIEDMEDDDVIVTVALVGAPAAVDQYVKPIHYIRALELLSDKLDVRIRGIITNENGAGTTVNGWLQSAMAGIPVLDAPSNGRAHPTGSMGAMNLSEDAEYVSIQAAAGGKGDRYMEISTSGSLDKTSSLIRNASIQAGGLLAVARNPVKVGYVKQNGAPGAIQQAIEVGTTLLDHSGEQAVEAVTSQLGGRVITQGEVTDFQLQTSGGFDVGKVTVNSHELTFWNEYMTLERKGERLATFPDLIMTFDAETGRPIVSAEISKGQSIAVIAVPKENLKLGATMRNPKLLKQIEDIIEQSIIPYAMS
ncbi:DUF917 domain-containing protein [Kroppenstedtia sanguinis]|uniref:DUF917 domain-containing protein n=1 Tax=Kroppenstedtia sanguinis TaxID=1380684 RepID=A0ABW4C776_9BACL